MPRTTGDQEEGPKASELLIARGIGKWLQLLPLLLSSPGGEQTEPLPAVKTCQHFVACEVGPHFTDEDLPRRLSNFTFPLIAPHEV